MLLEEFLYIIIIFISGTTNYITLKNLEKNLKQNIKEPRIYKSRIYYLRIVLNAIQYTIKDFPNTKGKVFINLLFFILSLIIGVFSGYFFIIYDIFNLWK